MYRRALQLLQDVHRTQAALAREIGVSETTMWNWTTQGQPPGKPNRDRIGRALERACAAKAAAQGLPRRKHSSRRAYDIEALVTELGDYLTTELSPVVL